SNRSFVRFYGRAMRFIPMPRRSFLAGGTLVALGELGWVAAGSRRDIPSENLFRAGGSHSVRGYGYQTLGVQEAGATVGGRYLGVASLEYQHPVTESIAAAVFYDVGNATDSTHDFKAVAGYGVGMRWRTPVGPLNLDLAYGEEARRWRIHFSVGYTFCRCVPLLAACCSRSRFSLRCCAPSAPVSPSARTPRAWGSREWPRPPAA